MRTLRWFTLIASVAMLQACTGGTTGDNGTVGVNSGQGTETDDDGGVDEMDLCGNGVVDEGEICDVAEMFLVETTGNVDHRSCLLLSDGDPDHLCLISERAIDPPGRVARMVNANMNQPSPVWSAGGVGGMAEPNER